MVEYVAIEGLKPNPKNPNAHPKEQVERLAELIKYQGWRLPIIVSKQSGFIVSGHGRLEAAKHLKLAEVPVSYQDFTDLDQEYAFLVSDNSVALWAELNLAAINFEVAALGPDFEIKMLGIKDFVVEPLDKFNPDPRADEKEDQIRLTFMECPHCGESFEKDQAKITNKF